MFNPFGSYNPAFSYLTEPTNAGVNDRDFNWEDGWEVLYLNTGYFPDGSDVTNPSPNGVVNEPYYSSMTGAPYIILYNRYTAIIRVFTRVFTGLGQYDKVKIGLKLEDTPQRTVTGLFQGYDEYNRPLNENVKVTEVSSAFFQDSQSNATWTVADFEVNYDPCTCTGRSNLILKISAVEVQNITLTGRLLSVEEPLMKNGEFNLDKDFLVGDNLLADENAPGGKVIYKRARSLFDDYSEKLMAYNQALKDKKEYENSVAIEIFDFAADAIEGVGGVLTKKISSAIVKSLLNDPLYGDTASKLYTDTNTIAGWQKAAQKAGVRLAAQGVKALNTKIFGNKPNVPSKPGMPTVTYSEMVVKGQIEDLDVVIPNSLMLPGSSLNNHEGGQEVITPFNYPAYNEVLGQFALLNKPSIQNYSNNSSEYTQWYGGTQLYDLKSEFKNTFRITEDLKYSINKALDLDYEHSNVSGAFRIYLKSNPYKTENGLRQKTHVSRRIRDSKIFSITHDFPLGWGTTVRDSLIVDSKFLSLDHIGNQLFDFTIDSEALTYEQSFFDIEGETNDDLDLEIERIEFKVLTDFNYKQVGWKGRDNSVMRSYTFLIYDANKSSNYYSANFTQNLEEITRMDNVEFIDIDTERKDITELSSFIDEITADSFVVNAKDIRTSANISATKPVVFNASFCHRLKHGTRLNPIHNFRFKTVESYPSSIKTINVQGQELLDYCRSEYAANSMDYNSNKNVNDQAAVLMINQDSLANENGGNDHDVERQKIHKDNLDGSKHKSLANNKSDDAGQDPNLNGFNSESLVDIKIYPNPTKVHFYLKPSRVLNNMQVEITSLSGKQVFFKTLSEILPSGLRIELPDDITKGIYFINLRDKQRGEVVLRRKLILL